MKNSLLVEEEKENKRCVKLDVHQNTLDDEMHLKIADCKALELQKSINSKVLYLYHHDNIPI